MKTTAVSRQPFGILLASWTDGTFISTSDTFLLEKNEGAGWVTVLSTEYVLHAPIGEIVKRDYDSSSGNAVVWADGASFRATYTLINSTTLAETTKTQEAQTADYLDEFVASDGEGEIMASAPRDLIVQEIFAGRGVIGKWTINKQYLARDTGTDATSAGMAPLDYPFFAGATYANRAGANFRVTPAGDVTMAGALTVGGNVSVSGTLTVTGSVKSDDFSAGVSGWRIKGTTSEAEFQNIKARGRFEAAVFVKGMESATAGTQVIAKSAGKLDADMVVPGAGTWTMTLDDPPDTGYLFDNNDICVVTETQGSTSKTWFTVQRLAQSGGQQTYTCTYQSGTRPNTFHKGNIVVDYGVSGQGFLYLTADDADGPFYSVRTHAGSPWSTTTERGRFGNMKNAFGVGANNYYGFGVGDYSGGNYLKYETNGGFQLSAANNGVSINSSGVLVNGESYVLSWGASHTQRTATYDGFRSGLSGSEYLATHRMQMNLDGYSDYSSYNLSLWMKKGGTNRETIRFRLVATEGGAVTDDGVYALLGGNSNYPLEGLLINAIGDAIKPTALLHLRAAAPTFQMQDLTASAKSLLVTVDANLAKLEEVGGAANNLLVLDLANARVGIGTASPAETFEVNTPGNNQGMRLVFTGTSSASVGPQAGLFTNDGAAMATNDRIGQFAFGGHNGASVVAGPHIIAQATETWSGTARGSKLTFYTVPNTTTSINAAMVIEQNQSVTFHNAARSNDPTGGVGYTTGAGGTVTQATSKSTGVTLNKVCGTITMNNAALAANTTVTFTLTNSAIAAGDLIVLNHTSGGTAGAYMINAQVAAGSATINVRNITTGSLSEAIVIRFAVIKAVTA